MVFNDAFTLIIIIAGLLFVAVVFIYQGIVVNPREQKELEAWKVEHKELMDSEKKVEEILLQVGESAPPCKKCGSNTAQLWDVNENIAVFRCTSCKRKEEYRQGDSNWILILNLRLQGVYFLIDTYNATQNKKLENFLKSKLRKNYFGLRKGSLYCRVFEFELLGNPIKNSVEDEQYKSRRIRQSTKDKVWRRDEGKCVQCGSNQKLEFDHIIPFSKGGSNTYRNIQLLCENCNRTKYNNI